MTFNREVSIIESALRKASRIGYRVRPNVFVDGKTRTCDPMGACMMFNLSILFHPDFIRGFANGFDKESLVHFSEEAQRGFELGRLYRKKYASIQAY